MICESNDGVFGIKVKPGATSMFSAIGFEDNKVKTASGQICIE